MSKDEFLRFLEQGAERSAALKHRPYHALGLTTTSSNRADRVSGIHPSETETVKYQTPLMQFAWRNLPHGTVHALARNGIKTVGDLATLRIVRLRGLYLVGPFHLMHIVNFCHCLQLTHIPILEEDWDAPSRPWWWTSGDDAANQAAARRILEEQQL